MKNKNKLILKVLKYGILFLFFLYSLTTVKVGLEISLSKPK